jgi:hypothetical protein
MADSKGKFLVLGEEPKFFLTTQDNKTIKVPKGSMSNDLQDYYRSRITLPSEPESIPNAPNSVPQMKQPNNQALMAPPMQAPAIQSQQQMPQSPMQPKGPNAGLQQQLGAAERLGELEGEKSQALFDINKQKADMFAQSPEEQVRNDPRFQQAFEQLESLPNEILKRNEELSNFKIDPNRLWNKSSTGQKIAGFLGLVLSGIGSGLTGKSNSALDVITRAIENDIDSQKEEKGALKESIMGMQTAYKTFKDFIGDEKAAKLMTLNTGLQRLQLLGDATAEKYNNLQAKERWALERGNIEQKIEENNQKIYDIYTSNKFKELEQLYKTMNTERQFGLEKEKFGFEKEKFNKEFGIREQRAGEGKEPNDTQRTTAGFALQARHALKDFENIASEGYDRSDVSSGIGSKFSNVFRTSDAVSQEQAERTFVTAVLRSESGANITEPEFERDQNKYFPRAGDSEKAIQQKAIARKTAVTALEAKAGKQAMRQIDEAYEEESRNQTKKINGRTYKKVPGGWEEVK